MKWSRIFCALLCALAHLHLAPLGSISSTNWWTKMKAKDAILFYQQNWPEHYQWTEIHVMPNFFALWAFMKSTQARHKEDNNRSFQRKNELICNHSIVAIFIRNVCHILSIFVTFCDLCYTFTTSVTHPGLLSHFLSIVTEWHDYLFVCLYNSKKF
jgi:hypothetical protein